MINIDTSNQLKRLLCICVVIFCAMAVQAEEATCITSANTYQSLPIESQTGIFEATFDATPLGITIDVLAGLSATAATAHSEVACAVRFNGNNGTIQARNGGAWDATATAEFVPNTTYHFRLTIDVQSHSYNIYVTPEGESEITVGTNFAFRSEVSNVSSLAYWNVSNVEERGTATYCNFAISDVTEPTDPCMTSSSSYQGRAFERQTDKFDATFDMTPLLTSIDVVAGLSQNAISDQSDMACIVRFRTDGYIYVRDGDSYRANASFTYTQGTIYHFRFVVNVSKHTYSVYVTPDGGTEITLGANYAFRSEQAGAGSLAYWSTVDVESHGAADVCNFELGEYTGPNDSEATTSTNTCQNLPLPSSQTGTFQTTFKVTPLGKPIDVVIGLSSSQTTSGAPDMSCIIRFSQDGVVIGYDNNGWNWTNEMAYEVNKAYSFRLVVNVAANTYSIFVTPEGGSEVTLATNYHFRKAATSLAYWSFVNVNGKGAATASDFAIAPVAVKTIKSDENGMNLVAYKMYSNQVVIKYSINEPGKAALSLYDITGRQIRTIENGFKEKGVYETSYDMSELPNGAYFIELNNKGRRDSFKLLK